MHPQSKAQPRKKNWNLIWVGLLIIAIGGTSEYLYYRHEQHEKQLAADQAAKIAADAAKSKDYAGARSQFQNGHFDPSTIHDAVAAEFHRQALQRANNYFAAKTQAERTANLDKDIDDMLNYRKATAIFRSSTTKPAKNNNNAQMIAWAVAQPPDTRARLAEFKVALDQRCVQRGLPPMSPGQ